ncbi:MAG TPA: hypothetical protein VHU90_13200 [Galbitalea sp.]|nr:hypothetical protein [Galbitalea sp.]
MRSEFIDFLVDERAGYEHAAEFELANQILQAASAIYVIVSISRSPQMAEVSSAVDRVHDWMSELRDAAGGSRSPYRADLQRTTISLDRAVEALRRLVAPSATLDVSSCARAAGECVASAASFLDRTRDAWGGRSRFMSNCCATDIPQVTDSRNE